MFDMDQIAARVRAAREARNPALTVRFIREDGREDSHSYATMERAEAFRAQLRRMGRAVLN